MSREEMDQAVALVAAVREGVGEGVELMIEGHGRFSAACAIEIGRRLERYCPAWFEEPVTPDSLDLLAEVKASLPFPIAAGERLYALPHFYRLTAMRAADVIQPDPGHCGGLLATRKIAAMAEAQDLTVSPHCSVGPVALCAALHFDWSAPNVRIQENFADYDVPWRGEFVRGWNPARGGEFALPEGPGLGIEIDPAACAAHPYRRNSFPSLWDRQWLTNFTHDAKEE
jgi:galactonate dehydratase